MVIFNSYVSLPEGIHVLQWRMSEVSGCRLASRRGRLTQGGEGRLKCVAPNRQRRHGVPQWTGHIYPPVDGDLFLPRMYKVFN
jgi:hypothetical protein